MKRIFFLLLSAFLMQSAAAQTTPWNTVSFPFTKDTASLEDMTGATAASFPNTAVNASNLLTFPAGFSFRYGMTSFSSFSISAYGYIKFGSVPHISFPASQDSVIAAFFSFANAYACTYKLTGTAPDRRMVIEWSGTHSQSGAVRFQLWLYERTGRIQFVFNKVNRYFSGNGYSIFTKFRIYNTPALASVKTGTLNQVTSINYQTVESSNFDSISAKTRYTFQPDTVKPAAPGNLNFQNVFPGCYDVVYTDSSVSEFFFRLEKLDTGINYRVIQESLSNSTTGRGTVYTKPETRMQPDSLYKYRVYTSNGFVNSDTVYKQIRTGLPQISGVKRIPGDYASISALLTDATCKLVGPDLVIELQNNYSYSLEPSPVRFSRVLQHHLLRNITVRPAAGANLVLSSAAPLPLFTIDSVKYVTFDGRPGGTGTTSGLTLRQLDTLRPAISYVYFADSGIVQYCTIEGRSRNISYGLVYSGYRDAAWSTFPPGVNNTIIRNCKIGSASGPGERLVVIDNNGRGENIVIENNELYRFSNAAIYSNLSQSGLRISGNRIYQPEHVFGNATAIQVVDNAGSYAIDSNKIGGSSPAWGQGRWTSYSFGNTVSLIDVSGSTAQQNFIRGNEFGNLYIQGGNLQMLKAQNTRVEIAFNKTGTTDSVNSVTGESHLYAFWLNGAGTKTVKNNFFSGLQPDYPTRSGNQDLAMLVGSQLDSLIVRNNDFGGTDNRYGNYAPGIVRAIDLISVKNSMITGNEIRGLTSENKHAFGILQEWFGVSNMEKTMIADSNKIHHLQGKMTVFGIYARLYSVKRNSISYNKIYALRGIGPFAALGNIQPPTTAGIYTEHFPYPDNTILTDTSLVEITGNEVHSLDYYTPSAGYIYNISGIGATGSRIRMNNNFVQLGIKPNGQFSDSLELRITGLSLQPVIRGEMEHNSIYIDGTGIGTLGIDVPVTNLANGDKNVFVSNNIIEIERNNPASLSNDHSYMPVTASGNSIVSNKNIWYSRRDANIAATLADWRARCNCDAGTVIADPKFINPAGDSSNYNLHLQTGSPADSSGTPSIGNIPEDFDRQLRVNYSPVDIGADAVSPCAGNTTGIQLNLSPDLEKVEICTGSTLNLSATVNGGSVSQLQWQKDLVDIPGATGNAYTVTQPGSYRVTGKLTCGKISSHTIIVLNGVNSPRVKLTSLTPIPCDSSSVTLKAEFVSLALNTPQLRWYKNNVLLPGRTGLQETFDGVRINDRYRLEAVVTETCGTFTGRDSVVISFVQTSFRPKVNILKYDSLRCGTGTDTIKYRVTNSSFAFPVNVLYVTPAPGATYRTVGDSLVILENLPASLVRVRLLTVPSAIQCYYPDTSAVLSLNYFDTAYVPVVTQNTNLLTSSSPVNNQWYRTPDNPIAGATSQTYTVAVSGSYFVRVISGTCSSAKSNTVDVVLTGLPQVNPDRDELQLFPNPAASRVWLRSQRLSGDAMISLYDATGRKIETRAARLQRTQPLELSTGDLKPGIYFVHVLLSGKNYMFKLIRQ